MSRPAASVEERLRQLERARRAYLTRRLERGLHEAIWRRYRRVVPHVFLRAGATVVAPLRVARADVLRALRGRAVWTLDTAARLLGGGLLRRDDLQGYVPQAALADAESDGLVHAPVDSGLSIDPPFPRDPVLLAYPTDEPPPFVELPSGDLVVTREHLVRDLLGTLGFRPDLLARLEALGSRG